ncbi:MAG: HAD-IC family P-type ATPase [Methanophagales archaeon]|nr:HAD-IC family P-type ATPase [Methanophagales archaeon]
MLPNGVRWYQLQIEETFDALDADSAGLTSDEAKVRVKKYGYNELEVKKRSPITRFLLQFHSSLLYILVVAAIICFFLGKFMDMLVILGVVLATVIIGFIQEGKAEASLEALKKMIVPECTALRDGKKQVIPARELVPGDVVILEAGDRVPADLRLFSLKNFGTDEAILTGESLLVAKNVDPISRPNLNPGEQRCLCFSGTFVTRGRGKGIVVETGERTEVGKIAGLIKETEKVTPPIMRKMAEFTRFLIVAILASGALTFALGLWLGYEFEFIFLATVGLIVAMIPAGLPAALTAAFAIGTTAMARRNALIRRLPAVETLGCTTVICSDKTGTLTKNEMTVLKIYCGEKNYRVSGVGYEPKGEFIQENERMQIDRMPVPVQVQGDRTLVETLTAGYLCNNAALVAGEEGYSINGDPTEGAMIVAATKAGIVDDLHLRLHKLDEIPFEPEQQYMATMHSGNGKEENIIYVKGSPEAVLRMCRDQLIDGKSERLRNQEQIQILGKADEMAKDALRVLGMAYKRVSKEKTSLTVEDLDGLTFLGLQGMIDPPREEAIEAIKKCKTAGIRVLMITGDHVQTAEAIASQLGIGRGEGDGEGAGEGESESRNRDRNRGLTGEELERMTDSELSEALNKVSVYARVAPEHKYRIVKQLQKSGEIVAVTGDGVNDAPALKRADIGIAMGITGTEVSKEASDMVLTDDNFASIVSAVEEGRHIFNNIWKVILFLLPTNGGQGLVMMGGVLLSPFIPVFALRLPLDPLQILWVNLVMAIACAIPLIWEPKEKGILEKPPRDPHEKMHNLLFLQKVKLVSLISAVSACGLFLAYYYWAVAGSTDYLYLYQAQTIAFTTIVMVQLFYLFTARSIRESAFTFSPFSNKKLLIGAAVTLGLQLIIIYSYPLFGISPFKTVPFPVGWWIPIILVSTLGFLAVELVKLLRRRW